MVHFSKPCGAIRNWRKFARLAILTTTDRDTMPRAPLDDIDSDEDYDATTAPHSGPTTASAAAARAGPVAVSAGVGAPAVPASSAPKERRSTAAALRDSTLPQPGFDASTSTSAPIVSGTASARAAASAEHLAAEARREVWLHASRTHEAIVAGWQVAHDEGCGAAARASATAQQRAFTYFTKERWAKAAEAAAALAAKLLRTVPSEWDWVCFADAHALAQAICAASLLSTSKPKPTRALFHADMLHVVAGPAGVHRALVKAATPLLRGTAAAQLLAPPAAYALLSSTDERPSDSELLAACGDLPAVRLGGGGAIARFEGAPSVAEFAERYYHTQEPVVMTGLSAEWPALRLWNDLRYFVRLHGHRAVTVEIGRHKQLGGSGVRTRLCTLSAFVHCFMSGVTAEGEHGACSPEVKDKALEALDAAVSGLVEGQGAEKPWWRLRRSDLRCAGYLAQYSLFEQVPELARDFVPPPYRSLGLPQKTNMWIGPAGSVTTLHYDTDDNCLCQIAGYKYVRVYERRQTPLLYMDSVEALRAESNVSMSTGNFSLVDVERPDVECYPLFKAATYREMVLGPGDTLYIPLGCWHYCRALTRSVSLNFWWKRKDIRPSKQSEAVQIPEGLVEEELDAAERRRRQ